MIKYAVRRRFHGDLALLLNPCALADSLPAKRHLTTDFGSSLAHANLHLVVCALQLFSVLHGRQSLTTNAPGDALMASFFALLTACGNRVFLELIARLVFFILTDLSVSVLAINN